MINMLQGLPMGTTKANIKPDADVLKTRIAQALPYLSKAYPAIAKIPGDNEEVLFEGKKIKVGMSTMIVKPLSLDKDLVMALHDAGGLSWGEIFVLGAADFLAAKHAAKPATPPTTAAPSTGKSKTVAELQADLEALQAENARLKAQKGGGKVSVKITRKGGLSVYGLGRFPVTLYAGQWERLRDEALPAIQSYLDNDPETEYIGSDKEGSFTVTLSRKDGE